MCAAPEKGLVYTSKTRKITLPVAAFAAGVLLSPAIAYAATGSFSSSSSSTPTVRATNSSTGLGADVASAKGTAFKSTSNGTHNGAALFLRQFSTGELSNGLYSKAYPSSGEHYGVWGVNNSDGGAAVYAESTNGAGGIGVLSTTAGPGLGLLSFGAIGAVGVGDDYGVFSDGDFGQTGFSLDEGGNVAGVCEVEATKTTSEDNCVFAQPIFAGYLPVVTLTPQDNPGSSYWVTPNADGSGFTINLASPAPAGGVTFGWQTVGVFDGAATGLSKGARCRSRPPPRSADG